MSRTHARARTATTVLIAGATAIALGACSSGSSPSDGETTAMSFVGPVPPSVFMFPGFVADELGFFADEGIDFTYQTIGEDVSMTSLLVNGTVDIAGPGATEVFQGLAAGQDFDIVYDHYKMAAEGIVTLADGDVSSVADLEGRTVGLAGDEVRSLLAIALDSEGMTLEDLEVAVVGTSSAIIANSLDNGTIDAFVGGVIDFAGLQAAGVDLRYITPDEVAGIPATSFIVTPETIEERGEALEGFLRAWSKGLHVGLTNRAVAEAVMREVAAEEWQDEEIGQATLDVAIDLQQQGPESYGSLERESWQAAMEQAVVAGDIDEEIALDSFLDDRFIEAINDFDRAEIDAIAQEWLDAQAS